MFKKIMAIFLLATLILVPMNSEAATKVIRKKGSVSNYVTYKIDGTTYTVSGIANYDKSGGLALKDYISWTGNISHGKAECGTDYKMYIQESKYGDTMHLPSATGKKKFFKDVKAKSSNCYAKLIMETAKGKY
ncbi:MAG: hypothetical protein Q4D32_01100, partial [Eubacteriales bacterium]|nr:hypothetical protein [Eubacteriales bacterium]